MIVRWWGESSFGGRCALVAVDVGNTLGADTILGPIEEHRVCRTLDAMQRGLRALCPTIDHAPAMVWEGFTSMPAWPPTGRAQRISVYVTSAQSRDPSDGLFLTDAHTADPLPARLPPLNPSDGLFLTDAHTVAWASACVESLRAGMRALAGGP